MDEIELLIDLHKSQYRQGPGGEAETRLAMKLANLPTDRKLQVADIGCGTGASTIQLAKELDAHITAVDFLPDFLNILKVGAEAEKLSYRIETMTASMESLPFNADEFDLIWSEGAIYNMGFENGVRAWKTFLKQGGVLAVSEITWLTDERPKEVDEYWNENYPEIATASEKIKILEEAGYKLLGYFPLPKYCWMENYYNPLAAQHDAFLVRHGNSEAANAIIDAEKKEIAIYQANKDYYSYGFYAAEKL